MKKILLALLLVFLIPLSACEKAKYEFKDGVMYGDGKEARTRGKRQEEEFRTGRKERK